MRKCGNVAVGEKLVYCESSVRGCVVIMEQPRDTVQVVFAECPSSDGEEHSISHITDCSNVLNLLKTERRPLYLKAQSVPRCKHFSARL
jgi:hypothetical protein